MKNITLLLSASLFIASCGPVTVVQTDSYQAPPPAENVSYQSFYDQLAPFGNWINYPGYGYVWMPNAGPDFQPYASNGNWIYTDAGWTWASDYSWGWAPFHYGRWFYENGYGWMWVPGNEWAPAWVSWRGGSEYYGWAPMGPSVSVDVALSSYNPPPNYWNFVPRQYMGNPGWHNYYVGGSRNVTIINNTTIINNYSGTNKNMYAYAPGPDPNEVRRYSGNNFATVQLRQANTPGARISGSQYQIYQPRVNNTGAVRGDAGRPAATPAPARYESFNNVRPSTQYPSYNGSNNNPPANNPPANNPRGNNPNPANPEYNHPVNNPPANNPNPPIPASNPPVNNLHRPNSMAPVTQPPPANPGFTDPRKSQMNHTQSNTHPASGNQSQTPGHPSSGHNPNNGRPATNKPATTPQNKPVPKPADKPKTQETNPNG